MATAFNVERFARVYTKGPEELPANADTYHDAERGWYFKLHLDGIATREAQPVVEKAADHFVVELVERLTHGEVMKERVYVESPEEVPEGFKVHTGPMGGLYYESGVQRVGSDDGEARDVAVIHWDDVEEGDEIVYETPDGAETFAEIVSIEERGDRADVIHVSIGGESERAMPGTYTVDKADGVYVPLREKEAEGSDASFSSPRYSEEDDEDDEDDDPVLPPVIEVGKQETWTYYYGPNGGEGWMNMVTGEIRYQQQRPGQAPEEGDGYDDWLSDDWGSPPDDLSDLEVGQAVEVFYDDEYHEGEVVGWDGDVPELDDETSDVPYSLDIEDQVEITAVEADFDRHDPWFDEKDFGPEEYFDLEQEVPPDAPEDLQALEIGPEYALELPTGDVVEVPFVGYADGDEHPAINGDSLAVHYDDLEANVGAEELTDKFGAPGETSPLITLPGGSADDIVLGLADEVDTESEPEALTVPDEYEQIDDVSGLSEGDHIVFETESDIHEGEVKVIDDEGVLTEDDKWAFPETMDVYAEPSESTPEGGEPEADPTGPSEDEMDDAVAQPVPDDAGGDSGPTADYDMNQYDESDVEEWGSLSEFGFPSGITAHAMSVGALPDYDDTNESPENNAGLVFKTEFAEGPDGAKPDLGLRQMVTHDVGQMLDARMPTHVGHPTENGYVVAEGVDGKMAQDVEPGVVDREDFMEQAAKQAILGNNDAHAQNVLVDPDGKVWAIDIDHSAGDMMDGFVGNKTWYGNAIDRATGELVDTAKSLGLDVSQQDIIDRAEEVAQQYVDDEGVNNVLLDAAQAYDTEMAQNVENNLHNFANGSITLEEEL